jgi:predicted HTH transcriptional regulator
MIGRKRLFELIEEGESIHCEFKRKFSTEEKIAKELMAFANTGGGYLIFGVDDDGTVVGVESEKGEAELIKCAANEYCEPPVNISIDFFAQKDKELVVVEVKESDRKPHRLQDYLDEINSGTAVVYVRVKDKSVQASKEMIRILRARGTKKPLINYHIGKVEKAVFAFLENNERITVDDLCQAANISGRRASRTLVKMVRADILFIHTKENGDEYFTLAS